MKDNYGYVIMAILVVVVFFGLYQTSFTGHTVKTDKIVIYLPNNADFPNDQAASVVMNFNFQGDTFKVGDKYADLLMFFDSKVVPGLTLGYDPLEKVLQGGLPLMFSGKIELLNNKPHQLVYSFDKGLKKQYFYLDGVEISQGEYTGEKLSTIVGFVGYRRSEFIYTNAVIEYVYLRR